MDLTYTNIHRLGEITGAVVADAEKDYYKMADTQRDHTYMHGHLHQIIKAMSNAPTSDVQILYGGIISDGGGGTVDISEAVAIGKDTDGNTKIIKLAAQAGLTLPSGWKDDRQIWMACKYDYKSTADTRTHWNGETYHHVLQDTNTGDTNGLHEAANLLFYDTSNPGANYVVFGSFKMSAINVFTQLSHGERSPEFKFMRSDLGLENLVYNSEMADWSNGTSAQPDGYIWVANGSAPTISKHTDSSAKMISDADTTSMVLSQKVDEVPGLLTRLKGQWVTVKFRVLTTSTTCVVKIEDGVGSSTRTLVGTGSIEEFDIIHKVDASATMLKVSVNETSASKTIYLYSIDCSFGMATSRYLPCIVKGKIGRPGGWFTANPPSNALELNGATPSRTTYSRLFSVLGVVSGNGDGATTFTLPDIRGKFARHWDHAAGVDPNAATRTDRGDGTGGDVVLSKQADAMQGHFHDPTTMHYYIDNDYTAGTGYHKMTNSGTDLGTWIGSPTTDGVNGVPRTTSETRSINFNKMGIVYFA